MTSRHARALAAIGLLALLAQGASAHAVAGDVFPARAAALDASPSEIWVDFTQKVDPQASSLKLLDADGNVLSLGPVTYSADNKRATATVETELGPGGYIVEWVALSTVDGHTTTGTWSFAVGGAAIPDVPEGTSSSSFRLDAVIGKSIAYVGLAIVLGVLAFALLIVGYPTIDAQLPPWRRILAAGAAIHLAGMALFAISQTLATAAPTATYLFQTSYGRSVTLRLALAVGLAGTALVAVRRPVHARRTLVAAGTLSLASTVSFATYSHTAEFAEIMALGVAVDVLHLLVVGAWAGGLVPLAAALRYQDQLDAPLVAERFSRLAFWSILLATATGVAMAGAILGWHLPDWFNGRYGTTLGAKVALVIIGLGGLGALNRFKHITTLRSQGAAAGLLSTVQREIAVAAAVFLLAGALTNMAPTADTLAAPTPDAPAEPFFAAVEAEQVGFHVSIDPGPEVATNSTIGVHVYDLEAYDGVPNATRMTFTFTHDGPFGSTSAQATEVGQGLYRTSGAFFPGSGQWGVKLALEHPDYGLQEKSFTLSVAN